MSDVPFTTRSPRERARARRVRSSRTASRRIASRRRRRRATAALALLLIALGGLALIEVGVTLVWQEPFTALYAKFRQDHLAGALRAIERAAPSPVERRALAALPDERRRIAFLAGELEHHARNGAAVGRIMIPTLNASYVVVKGTGTDDLKGGPGIFAETNFPGIAGTTAIAGHRTTYLAPFRHIDSLHDGNRILLYMPYAHFTYTVVGHAVVPPTDVRAAVEKVGYSRLVLSACTPLFSAAKRLLVFARLTRTVPVGAARELPGGEKARSIEAPRGLAPKPRAPRSGTPLHTVLESLQPLFVAPLV